MIMMSNQKRNPEKLGERAPPPPPKNISKSKSQYVPVEEDFYGSRRESEQVEDFIVLNDAAANSSFKMRRHEMGYPIAAQGLCKVVKSSSAATQVAGGHVVEKIGSLYVQRDGSGFKRKYVVLRQGKLTLHSFLANTGASYEEGDELPADDVKREGALPIQRIHAIRYKSDDSKVFSIVSRKAKVKSKPTLKQRGESMMNILTIRRMKSMANNTRDEEKHAHSEPKRRGILTLRRGREKAPKPSKTTMVQSVKLSKGEIEQISKYGSQASHSSLGSSASKITRDTDLSVGSQSTQHSDKDDSSQDSAPDMEEEVHEFRAVSVEQAKDWLLHILIEIENQALVFQAYADVLEKSGKDINGVENFLRHSIDLWTLAKGVNSNAVWKARERLALFLEKRGEFDEANMWFDLSRQIREDASPNGEANVILTMDESFQELVVFLQQFGTQLQNADEEARRMFEKFDPPEIAKRLHQRYQQVPRGWQRFLTDAKKSPLEKLQDEAEEMKRRRINAINDLV